MDPKFSRRYRRDFPHGLAFHRLRPPGAPADSQGSLSPEEFEAVLLAAGIENFIAPDEWMRRMEDGRLEARHVCVTFDDGLRSQFDHAKPVLDRHGLKAFWFVYSCVSEGKPVKSEIYSHVGTAIGSMYPLINAFLDRCPPEMLAQLETPDFDRYARWIRESWSFHTDADIRYRYLRNNPLNKQPFEGIMDRLIEERGFDVQDLARQLWMGDGELKALVDAGHAVGLHSYSHPYNLAGLGPEEQRAEYGRNLDHVARATGRTTRCMSHPLNSYGEDTLTILRSLGIRCGFRSNTSLPPGKAINPNAFEMAREDASTVLAQIASKS